MSTPNIVWLKNGRVLKQVDDTIRVIDTLPKRVYTMNFDPDRHEIFLEDFADEFHFDFKIYGIEANRAYYDYLREHNFQSWNFVQWS